MKYFLSMIALFFVSCAQQQVTLRSAALEPMDQLESKQPFTKLAGTVAIGELRDERDNTDEIGTAVTGMLNEETPIKLDVPANEYVRDRFVNGFAKRGIEIGGDPKHELKATIRKLRVWEDANAVSLESSRCEVEIGYEVVSRAKAEPVYRGTVTAQAEGTYNFLDTTDSNGAVLESCMTGVVEKLAQNSGLRAALGWDVVSRTEY